jgi:ubiquinone/menaquinone biosynthesis C-methylase UbiE
MAAGLTKAQAKWLQTRLDEQQAQTKAEEAAQAQKKVQSEPLFQNDFEIEDLMVFDDATLREMLDNGNFGMTIENVARSVHGIEGPLVNRIQRNLSYSRRSYFLKELHQPLPVREVEAARREILDNLFWELTYWKTPELYEELTEGEKLHPGIFQRLSRDLKGKVVLDAGAGSGRASFECLQHGAKQVYAVEPSPGLLHILEQKLKEQKASDLIKPLRGRFDQLPLEDNQVDVAISCSAFTADTEQGGEPGLAELQRVTKPGGKIVIIWPRPEDRQWFKTRGFHYVALPVQQPMKVRFRSLRSAVRCARRFYHKNREALHYLLTRRQPELPFSVLGFNPPRDYCWLEVQK